MTNPTQAELKQACEEMNEAIMRFQILLAHSRNDETVLNEYEPEKAANLILTVYENDDCIARRFMASGNRLVESALYEFHGQEPDNDTKLEMMGNSGMSPLCVMEACNLLKDRWDSIMAKASMVQAAALGASMLGAVRAARGKTKQ